MTTPSTTLTAAREAERAAHEAAAAATKHREQVEKEEQDKRPIADYDGVKYRLDSSADQIEWGGYSGNSWRRFVSVGFIRALASLLPRKPVEVTEAIKDRAWAAFVRAGQQPRSVLFGQLVAALESVAADLSAPVAVAAPTLGEPDGYVVKGNARHVRDVAEQKLHASAAAARTLATEWNEEYPVDAPHDVYALHRVPDETEGAANG